MVDIVASAEVIAVAGGRACLDSCAEKEPLHAAELPDWYLSGDIVPKVFARSGDAEIILDRDFEEDEGVCASELAWRECEIPIEALSATPMPLDQYLKEMILGCSHMLKQHVLDDLLCQEKRRCSHIAEWIDSCGGPDNALLESPLIITIKGGAFKIEDGYHRLGLAVCNYGARTVRAVCAEIPHRIE